MSRRSLSAMALSAALALGALTLPPTNTSAADSQALDATDSSSRHVPTVTIARRKGRLQIDHVLDGAKIYNVRYRKIGAKRWTWNGQTARRTSTSIKRIDANADYVVQVKAFINGSWRDWASFRHDAGTTPPKTTPPSTTPPTTTTPPATTVPPAASTGTVPAVTIARRKGRLHIDHVLDGAKIYNVRYRKVGMKRWTWNGQTARRTSTSITRIDTNADYVVQVKAFINGSWHDWTPFRNDAGATPPTTPPTTTPPTTTPPTTTPPTTTPPTTTPPTTTPPPSTKPGAPQGTPRVLIDTDLGGDPDDIQSLVRAIHYSDALDIEGIVSTEGNGAANPNLIREWIKRTDVNHLRSMGYTDLMTEKQLLSVVKSGTQDRKGPGNGRSTAGSKHLIQRAHAGSADDPLWVLAWGSLGTVAQALHDDPSIVSKIRIYSIGDFNSTSNLAAREYVLEVLERNPKMWWVENGVLPRQSHSTFRGVWETGNQTGEWNRVTFLKKNIRGHGTNSNGRFSRKLGDAFPVGESPAAAIGSLKEGDSPSLLYLLSPEFGGIGDLDDPTKPSWGGQFRRADSDYPNYYVDRNCATPDDCKRSISKHRVAYLRHWKLRWDRYEVAAAS